MRSAGWLLIGAVIVCVGACSSSATPAQPSATAAQPSATAAQPSATPAQPSAEPTATANPLDAYPFLSGYAGHFTGKWTNKTFGSTGSMTWDISADSTARTVEIDVAVGGPVFGGPGVKPEKILLTHLAEGTISGKSPGFGTVSGTLTSEGVLTIELTNVPGGAIAKVTISGKLTGGDTIAIDYKVTFAAGSGTATGTVTLKKA